MNNPSQTARLLATDSAPRPGDFPLHSFESRAAARMRLERARDTRKRLEIVHSVPRPRQDNSKAHATPRGKLTDGTLVQWFYVPPAVAKEQALRSVACDAP